MYNGGSSFLTLSKEAISKFFAVIAPQGTSSGWLRHPSERERPKEARQSIFLPFHEITSVVLLPNLWPPARADARVGQGAGPRSVHNNTFAG